MKTKIKVLGVGSGAIKIINRLVEAGAENNFTVVDCEKYELERSKAAQVIKIGESITRGLRTGGDILLGKRIARVYEKELKALASGADVFLLISLLGGGISSSVTAEVARHIKEQNKNAVVIAILTQPMRLEGHIKTYCTEISLRDIKPYVDTRVLFDMRDVSPNTPRNADLKYMMGFADDALVGYLLKLIPKLPSITRDNLKSIIPDGTQEKYFKTI